MITSLYVGLGALWIFALSIKVIAKRRKKGISVGDGGDEGLLRSIRAHGNAVEYVPIILILLFCYELSAGYEWVVHMGGLSMLLGRVLHSVALYNRSIPLRVTGMLLTFGVILVFSFLNVVNYFTY